MPGKPGAVPGARRTQVPSHTPMPGVDDEVIDAGAAAGAQLPPRPDNTDKQTAAGPNANEPTRRKRRRPGMNPNQGDLFTPFWPDE